VRNLKKLNLLDTIRSSLAKPSEFNMKMKVFLTAGQQVLLTSLVKLLHNLMQSSESLCLLLQRKEWLAILNQIILIAESKIIGKGVIKAILIQL